MTIQTENIHISEWRIEIILGEVCEIKGGKGCQKAKILFHTKQIILIFALPILKTTKLKKSITICNWWSFSKYCEIIL